MPQRGVDVAELPPPSVSRRHGLDENRFVSSRGSVSKRSPAPKTWEVTGNRLFRIKSAGAVEWECLHARSAERSVLALVGMIRRMRLVALSGSEPIA